MRKFPLLPPDKRPQDQHLNGAVCVTKRWITAENTTSGIVIPRYRPTSTLAPSRFRRISKRKGDQSLSRLRDTMPQAIRLTDASRRSCLYVPISQNGKVVDTDAKVLD